MLKIIEFEAGKVSYGVSNNHPLRRKHTQALRAVRSPLAECGPFFPELAEIHGYSRAVSVDGL